MSYWPASSMATRPPGIVVPSITEYCARSQESMSASGNCIALIIALEKVPTSHPSGMSRKGPLVTGPLLSSSIKNMMRSGKDIWNISRNRTRYSLAWLIAWVCAVNSRRAIISTLRHTRNIITLEVIDIEVILISPSIVTVSDTKEYSLMNVSIWTS